MIDAYEDRIHEYREVLKKSNSIDSLLTKANFTDQYDIILIKQLCNNVSEKNSNVGIDVIRLTRLLYFFNMPKEITDIIIISLSKFVFWPHSFIDGEAMKNIAFWSESVAFMLLSSAVLFRQRLILEGDIRPIRASELEYQILKCFLKVRIECSRKGIFDILSYDSMIYTICSLLNLIDFAMDIELASLSMQLLDIIILQIMYVTTQSGVCSLSPMVKCNKIYRVHTWGHGINNLIYLMTGKHANGKDYALSTGIEQLPPVGVYEGSIPTYNNNNNNNNKAKASKLSSKISPEPGYQPAYVPLTKDPSTHHSEYLTPCILGDFLCTSENYLPSKEVLSFYHFSGFNRVSLNVMPEELQDYVLGYIPFALSTGKNSGGRPKEYDISVKPILPGDVSFASPRGTTAHGMFVNAFSPLKGITKKKALGNTPENGRSPQWSYVDSMRMISFTGPRKEASLSISMCSFGSEQDSESGELKKLSPFQCELIPLFWSAGLLAHSKFVHSTKSYVSHRNLKRNTNLWSLSWTSGSVTDYLTAAYRKWTSAYCYAGLQLNVYKHDELLLSSFDKFNGGTCSYQQLPWIANIDGVGIWTQAGRGSENIGGFDVTDTHAPHVSQTGHILVAAYSTPDAISNSSLFGSSVRLYWPATELFHAEERTSLKDETKYEYMYSESVNKQNLPNMGRSLWEKVKNVVSMNPNNSAKLIWEPCSWWMGRRNDYYVAVCCTEETTAVVTQQDFYISPESSSSSANQSSTKVDDIQLVEGGYTIPYVVRKCSAAKHAWICVVGKHRDMKSQVAANTNINNNQQNIDAFSQNVTASAHATAAGAAVITGAYPSQVTSLDVTDGTIVVIPDNVAGVVSVTSSTKNATLNASNPFVRSSFGGGSSATTSSSSSSSSSSNTQSTTNKNITLGNSINTISPLSKEQNDANCAIRGIASSLAIARSNSETKSISEATMGACNNHNTTSIINHNNNNNNNNNSHNNNTNNDNSNDNSNNNTIKISNTNNINAGNNSKTIKIKKDAAGELIESTLKNQCANKNVKYFKSFDDFSTYCCHHILIEENTGLSAGTTSGDNYTAGRINRYGSCNNNMNTDDAVNYSIRVRVWNDNKTKVEIAIK